MDGLDTKKYYAVKTRPPSPPMQRSKTYPPFVDFVLEGEECQPEPDYKPSLTIISQQRTRITRTRTTNRNLTDARRARIESFRDLNAARPEDFGIPGSPRWMDALLTHMGEPNVLTLDNLENWLERHEQFRRGFWPLIPVGQYGHGVFANVMGSEPRYQRRAKRGSNAIASIMMQRAVENVKRLKVKKEPEEIPVPTVHEWNEVKSEIPAEPDSNQEISMAASFPSAELESSSSSSSGEASPPPDYDYDSEIDVVSPPRSPGSREMEEDVTTSESESTSPHGSGMQLKVEAEDSLVELPDPHNGVFEDVCPFDTNSAPTTTAVATTGYALGKTESRTLEAELIDEAYGTGPGTHTPPETEALPSVVNHPSARTTSTPTYGYVNAPPPPVGPSFVADPRAPNMYPVYRSGATRLWKPSPDYADHLLSQLRYHFHMHFPLYDHCYPILNLLDFCYRSNDYRQFAASFLNPNFNGNF